MTRRLLNLATSLSVLLSLSAAGMWARSLFVTEGWEFTPRLSANAFEGHGNYTHRLLESAGGRLVYGDYDWTTRHGPLPVPGYRRSSAEPLTPELRGRFPVLPPAYMTAPGSVHGRIPAVAEWWIVPIGYRRRFFAVSWLALAGVAAAPLFARLAVRWWRWRQRRLPSFPVLPAK